MQPAYQADYTKRLTLQLIAIIQRDQRDALDWVESTNPAADGPLASIVTYQVAPYTIPQFPAVLVVPAETVFDPLAVGSRHGHNSFYVGVAVQHQEANVCGLQVQDYLRALDAILMSLPLSDFFQSWPITLPWTTQSATTPLVFGTVQELFVLRHNYDNIRQQKDRFACAASMEVRIDREEI